MLAGCFKTGEALLEVLLITNTGLLTLAQQPAFSTSLAEGQGSRQQIAAEAVKVMDEASP